MPSLLLRTINNNLLLKITLLFLYCFCLFVIDYVKNGRRKKNYKLLPIRFFLMVSNIFCDYSFYIFQVKR